MRIPGEAFWIGSDHPFDLSEAYLDFRRDLRFDGVPARARLFIAADSRYRLWINGVYVGRGPARSWPHAQQVDEIDISAHLSPGENAIAAQVYSPGYSHFAYVHRGACGLLAWIASEGECVLVTDRSWRVRRNPSWDPLTPRVSIYGGGVEKRDLSLDSDWQVAPTDAETWKTPRLVAPANGPLWSGLRPRDVPLLVEDTVALTSPWRFGRAKGALAGDDPHGALRAVFAAMETSPASEGAIALAAGETALWAFDLGSSQIGVGGVSIDGAAGGETLLVSYAEKLRDGEPVISDPGAYCRMRPTDAFTLRPGAQTAEGFSQRGGRYLVFALHAPRGGTMSLAFFARLTRYPLAEKPLAVADPELAGIAALCRTSILNCLQDGFVDSVWRESSQWLGDCVAEAFALAALSDDSRPLHRAIAMAADGAYADGVLPSVLPGEVHAYAIVDYNFSWIELLDMYRRHPAASDAPTLLPAMMPVMARMLDRFRADLGPDGLIRSQSGRRLFLDWSGVDRREPNLTYNGRWLFALRLAATLAVAAGSDALAGRCRAEAQALAAAVRNAFRLPEGWRENAHAPASQLALALAVLTGPMDDAEARATADRIVARSLDLDDEATPEKLVLASPFMHHYVFLALDSLGRRDDIRAIIRARWGRWAAAGEPTTWENWNTDFPDGSRCHGFSAHPLGWIVETLSS